MVKTQFNLESESPAWNLAALLAGWPWVRRFNFPSSSVLLFQTKIIVIVIIRIIIVVIAMIKCNSLA